jgi:carbonic anhydrase/acetyltransferase-like protein (isoleucine patch superfamily)
MVIERASKRPTIDPSSSIAYDATVCGDLTIGPNTRVLHGARIIGEKAARSELEQTAL